MGLEWFFDSLDFVVSFSERKKQKISLQKSGLVVQHNYLIEANYDLTLQEKRIILWLASQVKPDDVDFKDHVLKISEFCKIAGLKSKNMHKEIEKITLSLIERSLQIYSPAENKLLQVTWLNSAEYLYNEGSVKLCFSPKLKPYLLELHNCFTKLSFENLMLFKSIYTIRLYELLKQYQKLGMREIRIADLRKNLGINANEYKLYSNFKKKIIETAKREINEKSDVQVDFLELKDNRKVDAIQFSIKTQKHVPARSKITLRVGHEDINISDHSLDQLRKEFSDDAVNQGLLSLESYNGTVKNPVLFLKKAIKEGWQPFEGKKQQKQSKELSDEIQRWISLLDESPLCIQIRKLFLAKEGEAEYKSWIQPLSLFVEGESIVVVSKNKFAQDWLEANYAKQFSDYSDGRKVLFRLEDKEVVPAVKKSQTKKSLRQAKAVERADVPIVSVLPEEAIEKMIKTISAFKKKKAAHRKQEITQEPPVVEVVKKKSLWERITSFWK